MDMVGVCHGPDDTELVTKAGKNGGSSGVENVPSAATKRDVGEGEGHAPKVV